MIVAMTAVHMHYGVLTVQEAIVQHGEQVVDRGIVELVPETPLWHSTFTNSHRMISGIGTGLSCDTRQC